VPDGVVYLPNAADLDAHPNSLSAKDPLRLVLYTRFWEFDAAMLVAVLAELFAAHPAVHLDVIGTGENGEEQQFATMLAHAGLSARVTMHGWVQPAQITPLLRVAAIALVPVADTLINRSRCSAKLLELLAAGIAVVGHDVGEMQTFVDHDVNGILVPAGDNSAFARALLSLVENPQRLSAMQEAAAESARLHQWDARVASCHTALQIAFTRAHARNRKR
jgi:glycosyltransferase involved in cell wall biosynthesis